MTVPVILRELSDCGATLRVVKGSELSLVAPKGSISNSLLERVREHKPDILLYLRRDQRSSAPATTVPTVVPEPERLHEPFPPSELQISFLMGEREDMEYHVRPHYYSEKDFDALEPARFEAALNRTIERQSRNLPIVDDELQLRIPERHQPYAVEVRDLRGLSADELGAELGRLRTRLMRRTLPLDRWPWIECSISLHDSGARLHYNNNNVFSDGFGSQQFLSEVMRRYHDPSLELPPLSLSFRDCALALRRIEGSELGQSSRKYWFDRIPTMPAPLSLPLSSGHNPRARSMLQRRSGTIRADQWRTFKSTARTHGLSPTNALLAVYCEVLARFSGSRHFLLNNMVTHRFPMHPEVGQIVGNFAALYPFEVNWDSSLAFVDRARRSQDRLVADIEHVYCSGVSVLQELNRVQGTPGRASCPYVVGSGLFMGTFEQPTFSCLETSQVLLDHQFWEKPDGALWIVWDLIEEAFPDGLISSIWGGYVGLLEALASSDEAWSRRSFELLPSDQRARREHLNATAQRLPVSSLHGPILEGMSGAEDAPAVLTTSEVLTYRGLRQRASRLGWSLTQSGLAAGERVLVAVEKGVNQVVAVYGVLAAGGAYVPISHAWPAERVKEIAKRAQATRAVADTAMCTRLRLTEFCRVLLVDANTAKGIPSAAGPAKRPLDSLAYVIFTSGSTGTPKGVAIAHGGASNTIHDLNQRFGVGVDDRILGVSALSFDLSVYDLFGSGASGAGLVLPTEVEAADPGAWLRLMEEHQVTIWNSAPALMQLAVETAVAKGKRLPSLRLVLLSGDWIPVRLPDQIREVAPNASVVSLGGATEASIWSVHYPISEVDPEWPSIPYGKPLANQTWHVLDSTGEDAPDWTAGELHIGGVGLAIGYWGDEDATAGAFVTHPRTGERLYKTGDRGRYLPDGNIEFLGRQDGQVKLQGFRVELGEVEHVLLSHPDVRQAVAIVQGGGAGRQLAAFVVLGEDASATPEALLAHARERLPSYMIPGVLHLIEALPLSVNGKVDRQALRDSKLESTNARASYAAPASTLEERLVEIWEDVLETRPIGRNDDFFDMGGQSFAALRVITRISKEIGGALSLGAILSGRTIAELARLIEHRAAPSQLLKLRGEGQGLPHVLVHPAGGNVLCYRELAELVDAPVYALQAAGLGGEVVPASTVVGMARTYVAELRTTLSDAECIVGGWSSGGTIAFEMARQLEQSGVRVARVLLLDAPSPTSTLELSDRNLVQWFIEDLNIGVSARDVAALAAGHDLERTQLLRRVLEGLRANPELETRLEQRLLATVFEVFCAIVRACHEYVPSTIGADLHVLRATDGEVSEFASHPAVRGADWGWGRLTTGRIRSASVPGSHHTILGNEHVVTLARELNTWRD